MARLPARQSDSDSAMFTAVWPFPGHDETADGVHGDAGSDARGIRGGRTAASDWARGELSGGQM